MDVIEMEGRPSDDRVLGDTQFELNVDISDGRIDPIDREL